MYKVIDFKTREVVGEYKTSAAARRAATALDKAAGEVRYLVQMPL
jgi:protein-disulfide isomerase